MSTSIPSVAGSVPAASRTSTSSALAESTHQDAAASDSGFSAVLAEFMQDAQPSALNNQAIANSINGQTATVQGTVNNALPELTATFTESTDGNFLPVASPVVAWSGMMAVADANGVAAMLLGGDANQALIGKPVYAANMNSAIQLADQQSLIKLPAIHAQASWESFLPVQLQLANAQRNAAIQAAGQQLQLMTGDDALAMLGQEPVLAQPGATAITPFTATARLDTAVGNIAVPITHPNWSNNLGESIKWMVQQHTQRADFRLVPPDLGMLEVRVQLNNNQTNITFSSPHAQVCDAVESALPRLREMFGQAGLQLGDVNVNVSHQSLSQQHAQNGGSQTPGHGSENNHSDESNDAITGVTSSQSQRYDTGLVDVYA